MSEQVKTDEPVKPVNLFEYQNKVKMAQESFNKLDEFLDGVWKNRDKSGYYYDQTAGDGHQKFIKYLHRHNEIKSSKYVGVIHFEDQKINLMPKIFYDKSKTDDPNLNAMHNHILWWLSYCRKIKFPNYQTSIGEQNNDFFEVLIYLFAKYTRELLSNSIYQQYEEINREQAFIKGRLNVNAYINENLSRGNWHKLNCTYDSFVFDNKFNRIIKYVTNILINASKNDENKKNLREILFILDEVSDERATAEECGAIKFNPVFEEFATVRDYCYLFLNNSISFDYKNDLKLFAFLLPMEYVFEDFIFGFIEKEIDGVNAKAQTSSIHLDVEKKFTLKPDLILEVGKKQIIADTKYKLIYFDDKDEKKAASQTDLYQMLAYAVRFEIDKIILFYPDTIQKPGEHSREIRIKDEFREKKEKEISVKSYQLPIINHAMFKQKSWKEQDLSKMFEETKGTLVKTIEGIRDLI